MSRCLYTQILSALDMAETTQTIPTEGNHDSEAVLWHSMKMTDDELALIRDALEAKMIVWMARNKHANPDQEDEYLRMHSLYHKTYNVAVEL